MQIPEGYKNSSLGIIPNDWEVKRLGECCLIKGEYGINAPAVNFNPKLPIYIRITDINDDGYYSTTKKVSVDNVDYQNYILQHDDIVFARTGATVGKSYLYNSKDGVLVFAGFLIKFRPNIKVLMSKYLKYSVSLQSYWDWVKTTSMRSGQPGINAEEYRLYNLLLPPLPQQQKIAEILGTWDEAIEKQSKLIDKLTDRKRGLMQQLLTGKKRLAGFSEEWKEYTYAEILKEVKRKLDWDDNELYQLISVRRRSGGLFLRERLYGYEIKTKNLRPAFTGDFLISKMQIVHGASGLTTKEFHNMKISGSYISLISKDDKLFNIEFISFWSKMPRFYHQTYISSYGVHIEKMTFDIESFYAQSIKLPNRIEQTAIANILTTADKEIELAKSKLELLRSQKNGLMQELLTGKTRVKID